MLVKKLNLFRLLIKTTKYDQNFCWKGLYQGGIFLQEIGYPHPWALLNKFRLKLYLKKYMENSSFWYFSFLYYYPYKDFSYMNKHWHTNFHISFLFLAFIKFFLRLPHLPEKNATPLVMCYTWQKSTFNKLFHLTQHFRFIILTARGL